MSDMEEDDEREQEHASSEGEGEDIGPDRKRGADDDSSEEEEDDPEEVSLHRLSSLGNGRGGRPARDSARP